MRSIRVFAKIMDDPYYEPTIMVHDKTPKSASQMEFWWDSRPFSTSDWLIAWDS